MAELVNRISRATHCLQFASGLNPAQWDALRYLSRANRFSRSPTALAEFLGTTKGTVSQTVRALENKGYVRRARHRADGRSVTLDVTAEGAAILEFDPIRQLEAAAAMLPGEAGAAIVSGLNRLMAELHARCGTRVFGACERCGHLKDGRGDGDRCGLSGEPLTSGDKRQMCVNFRAVR
ncbi:MAG: MarR family transcriptional regulator [Alphaproteobacteria bacterium]